jgi:hypothetical protein
MGDEEMGDAGVGEREVQDQVERHGLTALMHYVLGPDYTVSNYLEKIPHFEPLRRVDLAPVAVRYPQSKKPTFSLLAEGECDDALKMCLRDDTPFNCSDAELGVLLDTSSLGQRKKPVEKTKISLKKPGAAKKIKLKIKS